SDEALAVMLGLFRIYQSDLLLSVNVLCLSARPFICLLSSAISFEQQFLYPLESLTKMLDIRCSATKSLYQ
ncbi:hypothetical protein, partial [Vibrio nigripulchritudo]|uniref:hypothetical protein n=1 Tax=Vibrio nigripulchritudo TaxID=28173 RepID=UPI00066A7146